MKFNFLNCCYKYKKRNYLDKQQMLSNSCNKYNNDCAICLEILIDRPCIYMDGCHHIYHYDCIEKYIGNLNNSYKNEFNCPLCMSKQDKLYESILINVNNEVKI